MLGLTAQYCRVVVRSLNNVPAAGLNNQFSEYTGIAESMLIDINRAKNRVQIDFETAILIGEALQTNPLYLVHLEFERGSEKFGL